MDIDSKWERFCMMVRGAFQPVIWRDGETIKALGTSVVYCKDDQVTEVALYKEDRQLRIEYGAPAVINYHILGFTKDVSTDPMAQDIARKCKEYFTSQVIKNLPNNEKTIKKLKDRYL